MVRGAAQVNKGNRFRLSELTVLIFLALCYGCTSREVTVVEIRPRTVRKTLVENGRIVFRSTNLVCMPVSAHAGPITVEPGDIVTNGQLLCTLDRVPFRTALDMAKAEERELAARLELLRFKAIEDRLQKGAQLLVQIAQAANSMAEAAHAHDQARLERAKREYERVSSAATQKAVSESHVDATLLELQTAKATEQQSRTAIEIARLGFELARLGPSLIDSWLERKQLEEQALEARLAATRAQITNLEHQLRLANDLRAQETALVLRKFESGGRFLPVGTPLLLLGTRDRVEVVAELLTADAALISTNTRATVIYGHRSIPARVRSIEPLAFTKLSPLGVEQQRVNVWLTMEQLPADLISGARVEVEFLIQQRRNVIAVPLSSVQTAADGTRFVFVLKNGKLTRRKIQTGLEGDDLIEVTEGLEYGEHVVVYPDPELKEGERVKSIVHEWPEEESSQQ